MDYIYNINNLKCFNINDYLKYLKLKIKLKKCNVLMEETEVYNYGVNQPYDKLYKTILDSKKQVTALINRILELNKELKEKDIEKYNSSFITTRFRNLESDIVYKKIIKKYFFLLSINQK